MAALRKPHLFVLYVLLALTACRKDEPVLPAEQVQVAEPRKGEYGGFYLLNEGNMGSNKCTLDLFDRSTGVYSRNIFPESNPLVAMELGDVGNDLQIYRGRLWAAVNCSNFVEVMDSRTVLHLAQIPIPNCRNIVFDGDYAYVSSYAGPVGLDPSARKGYVAKVDVNTFGIVGSCTVGYQPEQMAVLDGKLFVANSGGYMAPDYDNTVSVIDLASFSVEKTVEVADNLLGILPDSRGRLWVSSRGNYSDLPSRLYLLDPKSMEVSCPFPELRVSSMAMAGDVLYVIGEGPAFSRIDVGTMKQLDGSFIPGAVSLRTPYSIAADAGAGEIYVTDAVDYVTPGRLWCLSMDGKVLWSVTTGDIPAHFAFFD